MRRLKKIVTAMLAAAVLVSGAAVPMEAQAASTLEKVLYGTAAMVFISRYFSDMDDHQQLQFWKRVKRKLVFMNRRKPRHGWRIFMIVLWKRER